MHADQTGWPALRQPIDYAVLARVLVCQHVAAEPLGLLDPMLRARGHRMRYANLARDPEAKPCLNRYQALIVLGDPMQVGQDRRFPHLTTECRLIERWLTLSSYLDDLAGSGLEHDADEIRRTTRDNLADSLVLAEAVFGNWPDRLEAPAKRIVQGSC